MKDEAVPALHRGSVQKSADEASPCTKQVMPTSCCKPSSSSCYEVWIMADSGD